MLPKKSRLPLRSEFPQLQKNGRRFDSFSFGLTLWLNTTRMSDSAKAAFIITKKVDARSVGRHEIKRKFVEALAPLLSSLPGNLDLLVFAKKAAGNKEVIELKAEFADVLAKANFGKS